MSTGQRVGIITLGVVAIIIVVVVVEAMMSGTDVPEGEKPYMHAVKQQLGLDKKGYDKDESFDLEESSPEEYIANVEAKINAMVQDGEISDEDAEAKMTAIRQDIADKF